MKLDVGPADLGTPESEWRAAGVLDDLAPWRPGTGPAIDHVLVVAPHPDDEILGPGGALRLLAGCGAQVDVVAVTDGEAAFPGAGDAQRLALAAHRAGERTEAFRRLGVTPRLTERLGLPDGAAGSDGAALVETLAARCDRRTVVLAPWAHDGHPDHDAVGRAAAAACDATGARLLAYLWWAWHWADPAGGQLPLGSALRCDLDRRTQAAKRWATAAYRSQIRPLPEHPACSPVLPAQVLRRAWRPFEVFVPSVGG